MMTSLIMALIILYRIQIKIKSFPNSPTAKVIVGDGIFFIERF